MPAPHGFKKVVGAVVALADNHDYLEASGVVLLQNEGQVLLELTDVVVGSHHDGDGGERR